MKKTLLSLFTVIALNTSAQIPAFESAQKFDCDSVLKIVRSKTDQSGNVYIGGYYVGTADFDPSTSTNNQTSSNYSNFIQKQNASGAILWTKFGNDANGFINYFDVDSSGNVYILGYFSSVYDADFGSATFNLTSNGSLDYFVTKLDSQGEFVWATSGGGANYEIGEKIVVNQNGEAYIAVLETTTNVFVGSGSNSKDLKISKLNSSGTQIWSSNFTNGSGDFTYVNLELDQNNNPITSGRLRGSKDFNITSGTNMLGSGDVSVWDEFLVKLVNATGAVSWANILNGMGNSLVSRKLAVDNQGNSYTYGRLSTGQVDFDASSNVANSVGSSAQSGFIHKTTSTGQHAWTITLNGFAYPGHIETDNQGNVYLLMDAYRSLNKYDNSGNNLWAFTYAVTDAVSFEEASSFNIDDLGSIYITGNGQATSSNHDTLSFDGSNLNGQITFTNVTNNTSEGFLAKFSQCLLSTATSQTATTITATQTGANYQWINCDNNTVINGENAQSFTPTVSGNYAVVLSNTNCSDTSVCISFTFSNVGINTFNEIEKVQLFPNPATNNVSLINVISGSTIKVVDVTGKLIYSNTVISNTATIETKNWDNGMYFIQIENNGAVAQKKLIINK